MKTLLHIVLMFILLPLGLQSQTTVTYTQQTGNNFAQFTDGTAGSFNQGGTEMGQYANSSGNKQIVSWRRFRTDGNNGGSLRSLQIGDKFTIRVSATRAYGKIGVALLASPSSYSSWNDRENNYAISANLDGPAYTGSGYGNWYIKYNGGTTSATSYAGDQTSYRDFTIEFTLTATNRMNVSVTTSNGPATTTFNDVQLNNSNPITDYAVFLQDDWDGDNASNIYWKQTTTVANNGVVSLGASNNSYTISDVITNGLDANSTSNNNLNNALNKSGTGTVTLTGNNTYAGLTTVSAGTLTLNRTGGSTIPSTNNVTISGGTLRISTNQTIQNLSLTSGTLTVDAATTLTITGTYSGGGTIDNKGTIILNGIATQSFPGAATTINNGTTNTLNNLTVNNSNNVTLDKSFSVAGDLSLVAGNLDINGNTLTLNGTVSRTSGSLSANGTNSTVVFGGPSTIIANLFTSNAVKNLTVNRSGGVSMSGDITVSGIYAATNGKLSIAGNTLTLNGTVSNMSATNSFVGSNSSKLIVGSTTNLGTVFFDQTTSADVTTTNGTNALQNLTVNGASGSVTLGNKVNLFEKLSVTNSSTLNTGDVLVLRSISGTSSNNTAYVDQVAGTINGEVVVEKYIHKQSRGWRALTAPVTYNGITQGYISGNWQSNFGYANNYGTRISGPIAANGIDDATTGSSLQTYNSSTGAWTKVSNTNTETMSGNAASAANKGFYIFIRGDRTVLPAGSSPNSYVTTTLAAKGKLQTGTQTFNFSGVANNSWLIGNPYACPVDMSSITYNNIGDFIYVWDPNLAGNNANTNGNYVTFDKSNWAAGPSSGSTTKYFQSGQAFFAKPSNASASITFNESSKAISNQNNQVTGAANGLVDLMSIKLLSVKSNGTKTETDGTRVKYGANYLNDVDENDAEKWISNDIENIALVRNGKLLSIEARPYITSTDTLFINLKGLSIGANYELAFSPNNFDATISTCKLIDNFLNTETPISLTSNTNFSFSVTNVAGSDAAQRFTLVLNSAGSLPLNKLVAKAQSQNNQILVDWTLDNESNVAIYTVEKSYDARSFVAISTQEAKGKLEYSYTDNNFAVGTIYYRVKATLKDGKFFYSNIVFVKDMNANSSFVIYPNPVRSNTINLLLNNSMEVGFYTVKIVTTSGREVYSNTLHNDGITKNVKINLIKKLANGTYTLQLIGKNGSALSQKLLIAD